MNIRQPNAADVKYYVHLVQLLGSQLTTQLPPQKLESSQHCVPYIALWFFVYKRTLIAVTLKRV